MGWKILFSFIFILFTSILLILYWFVPFKTIEFGIRIENSNFSLNNTSEGMQFYPNMRYPNSEISYRLQDCSLQKINNMERAFEIVSNLTILNFYPVTHDEEISVTCENKNRIEEGLFVAGEGGPTNVTKTEKFNVILHGNVLLIRESKCEQPNVALHELLHSLGFDHSSNPDNIMYPVTGCEKRIGEDIPNLINEIYQTPSYPDLSFESVSSVMHGKYLDVNMSVKNNGLKNSEKVKIMIYANKKFVKDIDLDALKIGYGKMILLQHVWVLQSDVKELEFFISSNFTELDKDNNKVILEIRNS